MSVSHIIILLFIGYIIFTIDKKQENFPVPVILVGIGIGLSFIPYFSDIQVTERTIYHVFLPALLFTSAYQFSASEFKKNAGIIIFLATIGIMLTVGLLGALVYLVSGPFVSMSFLGALVIASILTPTDPVSVVSIIQKAAGDDTIADVVEGESLLNDGTSIVIFSTLSGMLVQSQSAGIFSFFGQFLLVSLGGVALGVIFGWLISKAVYFTHHKQYHVMLSIVLAYGIFNIAEAIHVSGVLATVSAGVMLSFEFATSEKEEEFKENLDGFWTIVEPSILTLLFLLIGIEAKEFLAFGAWGFAFIIFALSVIVRFIIVMGTTQAFPKWHDKISWRESTVITWGGLKGSMSIYLILNLYSMNSGQQDMIVSLSFAAVLVSLVVQSMGVSPLAKKLIK
ncbi:cation:proton antiporter [Salinicoccus hispanicus]|uniref:Sodium:proton antiporter n=1 Tax=Salinicoccus hispanicus TaxID=157225 RepID=A0A6N8U367_9STAP|nr:sodium:proton antiporter [Salinicoccus hispanicus]MXQ50119.1 sodium:proton antiporter [Salinicoccus hispanicus]